MRIRSTLRLLGYLAALAPGIARAEEAAQKSGEPDGTRAAPAAPSAPAAPAAPAAPSAPAAVATPPTASSDEERRGEEKKLAGDQAMSTLRYADALVAYRDAYRIHPQPALLYNIGRALQAMGRFPDALSSMEDFRNGAPPELLARVPKLDQLIAELRSRVSELVLQVDAEHARVLVRNELVGTTPLAPLRLNAGPALLEVTADGFVPFHATVELPPGGSLSVPVHLAPLSDRALLVVKSPVRGARVFIDARPSGTVPTEMVVGAGEHVIVVRRDGYDEAKSVAVLKPGERKELNVALAETPPLTAKWWFWAGMGAAVAGGVVVTVALLTERSPNEGSIPPGKLATALSFR